LHLQVYVTRFLIKRSIDDKMIAVRSSLTSLAQPSSTV